MRNILRVAIVGFVAVLVVGNKTTFISSRCGGDWHTRKLYRKCFEE